MAKIVVADTIFHEPSHLERLRALGPTDIHDTIPSDDEELVKRLSDAAIAIIGWSHVTDAVIARLPSLKMISVWATGYDFIDLRAADARGVVVTNVPGYATEAVAEHVFAMLLSFVRRLPEAAAAVRQGRFDWREFRGTEIHGKTLGLIGTGAIGSAVARIARSFGLTILAHTAHPSSTRGIELGVDYVDLDILLSRSDFVSIHAPLTPNTFGLLTSSHFAKMKPGAILINVSRGRILDEAALLAALQTGHVGGACLDVLTDESTVTNNQLVRLPNVLITPHIAFHTTEALRRCTDSAIANIEAAFRGSPLNVVGRASSLRSD